VRWRAYREVVRIRPGSPERGPNLGVGYGISADTPRPSGRWGKALEIHPDTPGMEYLGDTYASSASTKRPRRPIVPRFGRTRDMRMRGITLRLPYGKQGQYDQAIGATRTALRISPKTPELE